MKSNKDDQKPKKEEPEEPKEPLTTHKITIINKDKPQEPIEEDKKPKKEDITTHKIKMDISRKLAEFVANLKFEDIPQHVIDVEKKSIIDNIAIISGGADGNGCRELVEYAEEASAGGKGEATVLGFNKKLPAIWAAFANASMVMALDFSDTSSTVGIHPNTSTFTVSLALSEKLGEKILSQQW